MSDQPDEADAPDHLTPEQREALDDLTPRARAFVVAYVGEAVGNATEAARIAGYASPHPEGARLLRKATIGAALEALRAPAECEAIATVDELRRWWSAVQRGDVRDVAVTREGVTVEVPAPLALRLRASELLGKSQAAFVERREVSGPGGGPDEHKFRAILLRPEVAHELAHEPPRRRLAAREDEQS